MASATSVSPVEAIGKAARGYPISVIPKKYTIWIKVDTIRIAVFETQFNIPRKKILPVNAGGSWCE
jgi:hypothetical protein